MDDGDCVIGVYRDRDAVGRANRHREAPFAREEDVTLPLHPGSRRSYHRCSVYLPGPRPLRRDI